MYAYRVPELVGNVRNDGPECIEVVLLSGAVYPKLSPQHTTAPIHHFGFA